VVFYFFTSSKAICKAMVYDSRFRKQYNNCLVTAAITAALLALPSNAVTWLTPRMSAQQIWRLRFPVLRYIISPFFSISTPRPKTLSRQKDLISSCLSVCLVHPSVRLSIHMQQLSSHWTDFHEIWYLRIFRKSAEKIKFRLKSDSNDGYFANPSGRAI
jgi:hypothetical protein